MLLDFWADQYIQKRRNGKSVAEFEDQDQSQELTLDDILRHIDEGSWEDLINDGESAQPESKGPSESNQADITGNQDA